MTRPATARCARSLALLLSLCAARCDRTHAQQVPPAQPKRPAATASPTPASTPSEPTQVIERALAYDPADPLGSLESADAIDQLSPAAPGQHGPTAKPAAHGCVQVGASQRVWPTASPAAIASAGTAFVIAGYAREGASERLFVVRSERGARPEPITSFELTTPAAKPRTLAPALAVRDANDLSVAFVDGASHLWLRRLRLGRAGHGAAVEVATGLDPRFAPALVHQHERTLLAWTQGATPMRTQLAVLSSEDVVLSRADLTPDSMGAAAPAFIAGASPPSLMMVDARNGMSPLLRVEFSPDGSPKPAAVALPVGMVSSPPQLAAAANQKDVVVAYAGIGPAATSAIGVLNLAPEQGSPRALVPGTSYGPLYVSAAPLLHSIVVAADAPAKREHSAPGTPARDNAREIHVHLIRGRELGPAMVIGGPGGASHAAVAHATHGEIAVTYVNGTGTHVAYLRCDEGG